MAIPCLISTAREQAKFSGLISTHFLDIPRAKKEASSERLALNLSNFIAHLVQLLDVKREMKLWAVQLTLGFQLGLFLAGCATPQTSICKTRVEFTRPSKITFSDNEKLVLCGDPGKESWKDIPAAQAEFTLRNFLKQRGYYHPTFQYQNELLSVDPGVLRVASSLSFEGEPSGFNDIRLRGIIGQALTSELIDKVENFTLTRLKNLSYACPEVKVTALEKGGSIHVHITPGAPYFFLEPTPTDSLGLYAKTLRRFDAFHLNSPFRFEWVKLSSNRAENEGMVVSSQFTYVCPRASLQTSEPQGLSLIQQVLGSDKHLLTLGAGASTEEFPITELSLKSVRLNDRGANLLLSFYGSQRVQKANTLFTDYIFKNAPRFDFAPNFIIEHDKESTYNSTQFQLAVPIEYHGDLKNHSWLASFGPAASRLFSVDTTSDKSLSFLSLLGRFNLTTHDYELYQTDPRSGWIADLNIEMLSEGFSLHPLAMVYRLSGSRLFELNPVDPPQWLIGLRYGLAATDSPERPQTSRRLPPQYFNTLGGDQNLRGFGRKELSLGTIGAMTSAYLGTEVRYAKTLPFGMEPFGFLDVGSLGNSPFHLASLIYYSPGLGIRWSTPFGAIRGTFSHGYLSQKTFDSSSLEHLQIFLSFGREF